jgi:hypothetical protein
MKPYKQVTKTAVGLTAFIAGACGGEASHNLNVINATKNSTTSTLTPNTLQARQVINCTYPGSWIIEPMPPNGEVEDYLAPLVGAAIKESGVVVSNEQRAACLRQIVEASMANIPEGQSDVFVSMPSGLDPIIVSIPKR